MKKKALQMSRHAKLFHFDVLLLVTAIIATLSEGGRAKQKHKHLEVAQKHIFFAANRPLGLNQYVHPKRQNTELKS